MLMRKNHFFVLAMMLLLGQAVQAQVRVLTGRVVSSQDNKPIAGATITATGGAKTNGVAAGPDGRFSISVPSKREFILEISAVGYETKQVSTDAFREDNFTIALKEASKGLDQVVVVGYGTVKKKDLTGSVGLVSLTNTEKTPITGTNQLLEGTVAGVQVTQTNAQPGSSFTVRIRGTNSITYSSDPLYVVDDFPGADISTLNPNDIASIQVLKDASDTAIFGNR